MSQASNVGTDCYADYMIGTEIIEQALQEWQSSLCAEVSVGGLYKRNPVVHKWKVTYRSLVVRELASWRLLDLLRQAFDLEKARHVLGARIILRSAVETLALLIFSNQKMETIVATGKGFHEFSNTTSRLLLGSKNKTTGVEAINILTVLDRCDRRYEGIRRLYDDLSETAHPNWQGICAGYSVHDNNEFETRFENRWSEIHGESQHGIILLLMEIFEHEYNEKWPENFDNFETWIQENDDMLESSKQP